MERLLLGTLILLDVLLGIGVGIVWFQWIEIRARVTKLEKRVDAIVRQILQSQRKG